MPLRPTGFGIDPFDDDEVDDTAAEIAEKVFGPESVHSRPSDEPDVSTDPFADRTRGQYDGFPFKNPPGLLDDKDKEKLQYLAGLLTHVLRNSNFTAALPAHNKPTVWSEPIDLSAQVVIPAAAAAPGVWQDIITFQVPNGRKARIWGYGYEVDDPLYTYDGSIQFRLVRNNEPVYTQQGFIEQRGTPVRPRRTVINLDEEWTVKFQARRAVASAAPQTLTAALVGWIWTPRNDFEGTRGSTTAY